MRTYPVNLDVRGRRCVVIGGGRVAEGKVDGLVAAGARVVVIAPECTPDLAARVENGEIEHVAAEYRRGDLAGAFLAVSATGNPAVDDRVRNEATVIGVLLNVVDDPARCDFIVPSVARRGDLVVAVSTGGNAPALAVRLRERIERMLGDEYARFLTLAGRLREPIARAYPEFARRRAVWYALVDSDVIDLLREGDDESAVRRVGEITGIVLAEEATNEMPAEVAR